MNNRAGMGQNMRFFYFSGDCASSKDQIRQNFLVILDRFLRNDGGCSDPANARVCESNKVKVECGKTQLVNGRYRRGNDVSYLVLSFFFPIEKPIGKFFHVNLLNLFFRI